MMGLTPPLEGGSERHIWEISSRIKGCRVFTQRGTICKNSVEVPLIEKPVFLRNVMFFFMSLIYAIWLVACPWKKYDIIHIHENLLYVLAVILRIRYKIFITVHGITGFKFYENKVLWFFFGNSLRFCNKVISVSMADKKLLGKILGNVVYIPNGVDIELYKKIKEKTENKITFLGRIHEQKGVLYLLVAFEKISKKFKNYKLEIIGNNEGSYYEMLASEFKNPKIIWKGFVSDRKKIFSSLASSEVIVYPSLWEALPWPALLEGLGSGRPVIASKLEGMGDVFKNGENIILVPMRNPKKIREAIEMILLDRKKGDRIGRAGAKKANEFSWDAIAIKVGGEYG